MWLKNLRDRFFTGVLLLAVVAAVVWFRGWVFGAAITVVALISQLEMFGALRAASFRPGIWPGLAFSVLMYPVLMWKGLDGLVALFTVFCAILIANSVLLPRRRFLDTLVSVFAMIYPCWFFLFLLLLNDMNLLNGIGHPAGNKLAQISPEDLKTFSRVALGLAIVGPIASDVGGYFIGHFFGRHKLAPQISPKKTIEGAVGAVLFTVLVLSIGGYVINYIFHFNELPFHHYLLLGIMISALAQAGDLMASSIKRFAGIKDFSSLLPGHGGFMDRVDSILFGGVAVFCYLELFYF
jgi:phosphatidate cytidylyltransferase